jgi:hypothetical protein
VWNLATGSFNPFFNSYFATRFHLSAGRIGLLFSMAQVVQAGAILAAPLVLRRLGPVKGVAATLGAAAVAMAALGVGGGVGTAALAYTGFTVCQYMSEPGLYSLLMGGVAPGERGGAAALHFLVAYGMQAVAAVAAGMGITRFGYPAVLGAAAAVAAASALLFRSVPASGGGSVPE